MDSLITATARALAASDPFGALKRVALRDVNSIATDGKMISDEYSSRNGEPETLLVPVEAMKK